MNEGDLPIKGIPGLSNLAAFHSPEAFNLLGLFELLGLFKLL